MPRAWQIAPKPPKIMMGLLLAGRRGVTRDGESARIEHLRKTLDRYTLSSSVPTFEETQDWESFLVHLVFQFAQPRLHLLDLLGIVPLVQLLRHVELFKHSLP